MSIRVGVAGASGRMGSAIIKLLNECSDARLSACLVASNSPALGLDVGKELNVDFQGLTFSDSMEALVKNSDVIIDFTRPEAALKIAEVAIQNNTPIVSGTTGFTDGELKKFKAASEKISLLWSPNMSLGVNLLKSLVYITAKALREDFDIEIVEMHHRNKVDNPSGTAFLLGEAAAGGLTASLKDISVYRTQGVTGIREKNRIGFASLRGGTVVGDHSVIFAGHGERIELTHRAESRDIFANGAIKAALWLYGKKPGLYGMEDVLGLTSLVN